MNYLLHYLFYSFYEAFSECRFNDHFKAVSDAEILAGVNTIPLNFCRKYLVFNLLEKYIKSHFTKLKCLL